MNNEILIEALKEIVSPILYMQKRLGEGERLDGMNAIALSQNYTYLQSIAKKALEEFAQQNPER